MGGRDGVSDSSLATHLGLGHFRPGCYEGQALGGSLLQEIRGSDGARPRGGSPFARPFFESSRKLSPLRSQPEGESPPTPFWQEKQLP